MDENKQEEEKRKGVFDEEELDTLKKIAYNIMCLTKAVNKLASNVRQK